MTQHEDYVTYEQAVKLKELGFDWSLNTFYSSQGVKGKVYRNCSTGDLNTLDHNLDYFLEKGFMYSAPTLAMAAKWLRETNQWHIIIIPQMWKGLVFDYSLWHTMRGYENKNRGFNFSSYEAALSAGLTAVLEILINRAKEE